jgi:hypothetical protein
MGKGWEGTAASEDIDGLGSCEAHHVSISQKENRGGTAGTVGEGEGGEEEGGLRVDSMKSAKLDWKTQRFFRMWPRALFHMKEGTKVLNASLSSPESISFTEMMSHITSGRLASHSLSVSELTH